ncbi:MAG: NAD(P)H-dependent oxidoreductase [Deltaproteobacteria bacterium]|nr:NAD(P)H-dependent oxidoreductase [Deltaproteobacteria bacterium]
MKIAVLNGSPKGTVSVTVQYIRFLQKKLPDHDFKLLNISHDIQKYEKNLETFRKVIDDVRQADGVIWAFPLYVFLVASQYKRFIEMIWEQKVEDAFRDKYACAFSTSVHFFDNTAHRYIREICEDLGMKCTESFSADMDDLFIDQRRENFLKWAGDFLKAITDKAPTGRFVAPVVPAHFIYKPGKPKRMVETGDLKISVLADMGDKESNTAQMVDQLSRIFNGGCRVYDVWDIDMRGGCLGCLQCAFDNKCFYKDGFVDFVKNELDGTDIMIFAGAVKDRFFSARLKMFWDRSFFRGHIPSHIDKQMGFIVSGPLAQLPNMQEIIQGYAEIQGTNLAGIVTDESGDSVQIDASLEDFAVRCVDYAQSGYIRPQTFLGVGGHKIFRDQIWSRLRFPFDADFKFYLEHNLFDFPQNDKRYLEFSEQMIAMIQDPDMREAVRKAIKKEMLSGYKKVVEEK